MNKVSLKQYATSEYNRQSYSNVLTAVENALNRGADGFLFPSKIITATYTINTNDNFVLVDATAGVVNVTLPIALESDQKRITVKKIDASANAVNILRQGTSTIDGAVSKSTAVQYVSFDLTAVSGNWYIV